MLQIDSQARSNKIHPEISKAMYWLKHEVDLLDVLIRNMPASDAWKMVDNDVRIIENKIQQLKGCIEKYKDTGVAPEWVKNHLP